MDSVLERTLAGTSRDIAAAVASLLNGLARFHDEESLLLRREAANGGDERDLEQGEVAANVADELYGLAEAAGTYATT